MILFFFNPAQGGGASPNQFSPPVRSTTARWNDETPPEDRPFHARWIGVPVSVNVWKLLDGSYTENQPPDALVAVFYMSARSYIVSDAEKAALEVAGYEVG